jgi:hypothetical protein
VTRALRLGYNVFSLDGDTAIFGNFYKVVRAPIFEDVVWWNQPEWGMNNLNGGVVYIRNAKPNGPAIQTLYATIHHVLRWQDDEFAFAGNRSLRRNCNYMVSRCLLLLPKYC